ncbi:MAG: Xylulose kinase [Opitutia bacterium UBA7350]|nr:MAG: Xylulose kinase [Opitutae bacterium UBA7350]
MYTLGLDASTQSFSAVVIDTAEGSIVAEHAINFGQHLPQYNAPQGFIPDGKDGEVHADPRMWLDALELLLQDLGKLCDLTKIKAISGAGQQHGSVYLNKEWFKIIPELNPKVNLAEQIEVSLSRNSAPIWMDRSTHEECREISAKVGGDAAVCERSGSIPIERFSGPQIRRFYKNEPIAYESTARIHLVSSFICSVLCGNDCPIDTGDASGMNLMNIEHWDWDPELLHATAPGLVDKLPPVRPAETQAGILSSFFSKKFGLPAGIPVTLFTGDNPSSLVGMGASQPGKIVVSLGTSDTFFAAMPQVVADPKGCGHVFGNPMGGSMSLQCFVNGSLAREAVKDKFHFNWNQFTNALENTKPGNGGQVMLPFFRPEVSPRLNCERPLMTGSEAFCDWQEAEAAVRACVEGQFLNMKCCSEWMQLQPKTIYLTGGASKNDAIAQILADIFQVNVERLAVSGSVALGAAMRAACQSSDITLDELELSFCSPLENSLLYPQVAPHHYDAAAEKLAKLLEAAP